MNKIIAFVAPLGLAAVLAGTAHATVHEPGPSGQIKNVATGYVLDSAGTRPDGGGRVAVYANSNASSGSPNLQWTYDPDTRHITNVATGYVLDSAGLTSSDGGRVAVYANSNASGTSRNLKWTYDPKTKQIKNVATGYVLDSVGLTSPSGEGRVQVYARKASATSSANLEWSGGIFAGPDS